MPATGEARSSVTLVAVACFVNVLDYELVVQTSIKSAEEIKGKSIGISRLGSVTDVAAELSWQSLNVGLEKT